MTDSVDGCHGPEDVFEIMGLTALYAHVADSADWGRLGEVFTSDAEVDYRPFGGELVSGLRKLTDFYSGIENAAAHVINTVHVEPTDEGARCRSKLSTPTATHMMVSCNIEDDVVQVDGRWLVRRRRYSIDRS